MSQASERLGSVEQIQRNMEELERHGLWKSDGISNLTSVQSSRDEALRILGLIEMDLERAGLCDRNTAVMDDMGAVHSVTQTVTLDEIAKRSREATAFFSQRPPV